MNQPLEKEDKKKNEFVDFGKHKGERWTRLPISYLKWLVNEDFKVDLAKAELDRRGTILERTVELSSHSVDRFYMRYHKKRGEFGQLQRQDLIDKGGIYSYLLDLATRAYNGEEVVEFEGWKLVYQIGEYYPVLKSIM